MLVGKDIVIKDRSMELAKSLRTLLSSPQETLAGALKAVNNLVSCVLPSHAFLTYELLSPLDCWLPEAPLAAH